MKRVVRFFLAVAWATGGGGLSSLLAQLPSETAVRVSAQIQTSPPRITLAWPGDARSVFYSVARKLRDDTAWGSLVELGDGVTSYTDTNVVFGRAYEYWISKRNSDTYVRAGEGFIYAGMEMPPMEARGKVVLVVDNTFTTALANELNRLHEDLVGDGWNVLRHDVPRMAVNPANTSSSVWAARSSELASVKALIQSDYAAAPGQVKAVFLLGHVPVPYSGDLYPDLHSEHRGAWPADGYYGDMDGHWTDSNVNRNTASDPRNRNVPGDGKFDQTFWPLGASGRFELELQVGRVDFANLPAFALSEEELLRQYLNKDHAFRRKIITVERRGLIDDNFGYFGGEAPAGNGWRNFAPFFGASNAFAGDWLATGTTQGYLWGFGCGGGTYTSCAGVATTPQLATNDPRVVFTMLHGSYFGDWDSPNNLLRASIATPGYTLSSAWVTRPQWYFHHMALGETIGFSSRVTQNNNGELYPASGLQTFVHIALMGDPTLRMHIVAPPSALVVQSNDAGGVELQWSPSPEAVAGYHVYRAPTTAGPFVRVNSTLINRTNYTDPVLARCVYMVRAVKLEQSASGSYFNASQGVFQDFTPPSALPLLVVGAQDASMTYGEPLPTLLAAYTGFVNGDTPDDLDAPAVLSTPATTTSPAGTYPIQVAGAADTNYTIAFAEGILTIRQAPTTGILTSTANPSLPGETVSFTFMVSSASPGLASPSGLVQFRVDGESAGEPLSLNSGAATFTATNLTHGWHWVEADYAGERNFSGTVGSLMDGQIVNTPPVATADALERDPTNGVKVLIATLLNNDFDADGDPLFFLEVSAASANEGTVVNDESWIYYTPKMGSTNVDTFTYRMSDGIGPSVTGLVTVNIRPENGPPPHLTISELGNGSCVIQGDGVPGQTYRIVYTTDINHPEWQSLGTATASPSGVFLLTNTVGLARQFYRSVQP